MKSVQWMASLVLVFIVAGLSGQSSPSADTEKSPGEPESLTRLAGERLVFKVSGTTLVFHDLEFNDQAVPVSKLHLRQLAPGVVEITSVAYTVGYWHIALSDSPDGVYGLGERFDVLNRSHTIVRNTSQDNGGAKGSTTYKPMPFYLSTTGYGLWLDTMGEATFDLNASARADILIDLPASHLRIVLFTGADGKGRFPSILRDFTGLASGPNDHGSNRAIVPPYWAFAPWQGRDYQMAGANLTQDIDRMRELGLPASVFIVDAPWATGYNSYQFSPKLVPDAAATVKHLHDQGFKMILWHTAWINSETDKSPDNDGVDLKSSNYDEAASNGYFVRNPDGTPWIGTWWKGRGSLIDFTSPAAKQWWQGQLRQAVAAGADGFKDDDGEGNFQGDDGRLKFADGTDPRLMRNRYGVLYNDAVEEVIQKDLKGNGALFARSVTTGANAIGFVWGGDNGDNFSYENGLPSVVLAGMNAGLSGIPLWTADLGGYNGHPDGRDTLLLQRWTEFSAFLPVMETMMNANLVPWEFDRHSPAGTTPALDTYRKFAKLHMSLFPYRYAAAQEAAATGKPLIRALVLDYQDDARARTTRDEYLFGPDLLVAPVIDENTSRAVYLPAGDWLNLFTGEAVTGPKTVVVAAPADTIPVFARRGTILPKIPEDVMTLVPEAESGNKTVKTLDSRRVYELLGPAVAAPVTITDFEGRTLTRTGNSLSIEGAVPAHIILRWRFPSPQNVSLDGAEAETKPEADGAVTLDFDYAGKPATITWK